MMWELVWAWATEHYIFHAIIVTAIFFLVFSPGLTKRFKKIKAGPGGIELDVSDSDIDPNTPCPYRKSQDTVFNNLRDVGEKVDKLEKEVKETFAIVKNMAIDQQKQMFYDSKQPDAERLAGGLKYVSLGGNGNSRKDIERFADEHKDIYNALTYVKPELRLVTNN